MNELEQYIYDHYDVQDISPVFGKVIVWNEYIQTSFEGFKDLFGDIIMAGIEAGLSFQEISQKMVIESIKMNYGLTEVIIHSSGVSIF
ncbi:hypothetical protein [Paenibacillus tundrae]|uniref:Uncharacterized protein n=1 Tax=Paenibacillus tundrae TaxID=528187 RepID=A0ABT9W7H6_9BACL|nr:hypothetical protein [Paenibacillus tundrae]MDQ0169193.1 hypothetical protein [Paenibacillus tundrae]